MNNIHDMRKKRGEIWDRAKAFLTERQDENGMLSAEDTAQYERMEQEVVDLGRAIERAERADALEREMNAPTASPLASRPESRPVLHRAEQFGVRDMLRLLCQRQTEYDYIARAHGGADITY